MCNTLINPHYLTQQHITYYYQQHNIQHLEVKKYRQLHSYRILNIH